MSCVAKRIMAEMMLRDRRWLEHPETPKTLAGVLSFIESLMDVE